MRDIAILFVLFPMLYSSLRFVHSATMFWIWTALAGPATFLYGFLSELPFNKIAVGVTVVSVMVDRTKKRLFFDSGFVLHTLFVLQGVLSVSFGLTDIPRTYDLLDKMVKIWILSAFMRVADRGRLQIHSAVAVFSFSLGLHGILEGAKYIITLGGHKVEPSPVIGDNNYLALAILMLLPFFLYLFKYSVVPIARLGIAGLGSLLFIGFVATNSRGGLIGLAVLVLIMIGKSKRKGLSILAVMAVAGGLLVVAPSSWLDRMDTIKSANTDGSFMSRVASWKLNSIVALDRPFLGGGYSALEDGRVYRAYLPQFGMLDFIPSELPAGVLAAHSIYFQALGDVGFIGLGIFLAMLAAGLYNVTRIRIMCRGNNQLMWAADLAVAFQLSLAAYLVCGAALSAAYFEILYIQLTLLSILRRSLEESATRRLAEATADTSAEVGRALVAAVADARGVVAPGLATGLRANRWGR